MPSPSTPRSKSAPDINSQSSPSNSYVPPPSKSFVSSSLTGRSPKTSGPKKLSTYITGKTKNSHLTEASLRELNRRNTLEDARISTSSPYYKGLTDFSLVINREWLSGSSHGRESHATSSASSGSKSSLSVKVQEWSSRFTLKKHEKNSNDIEAAPENLEDRASSGPARTHNQIRDKSTKTGSEYERKKVTFPSVMGEGTVNLSTKEKPLREKESEPPYLMIALSPPTGSSPEDVHCHVPQITPPTAQTQPSLLSTPISCAGTPPPVQPALESLPSLSQRHPAAIGVTYKNKKTTKMIDNERKYQQKLSTYITGKTKNSHLTEASLRELNRRNALEDARISTSSPYYKGLTDFSLVINRERLPGSSPGRESHATSSASYGSKSSFSVKVQEWSSWFTLKKHEKNSNDIEAAPENLEDRASSGLASTHNQIRDKSTKTGSEYERKKVTFPSVMGEGTVNLSTKEKPLREKESEPPYSMIALSPPTGSSPEDVHCHVPQITPPTAQTQPSLLSTPISCAGTPPPVQPALESLPSLLQRHPAAIGVTCKNKETTKMIDNERKYVWADKYRPFLLKDFICNQTTALRLQSIVRNWHNKATECGHFIFEGSPGVGKRTMIWALLREAFGPDKVQAREESKEFHLKGEAVGSILVNWMVSTQHIEVNISELKGYEKHILVELIKEENQMLSNKTLQCTQENCKAIILHEADKLSTDALTYIKWMLGKFKGCNKVFFCCSDMTKLLPLKPLCTVVQLLEPSNEEIVKVLMFTATQEGVQLPQQLANKIANRSKNNLRQAIRSFEATWHFNSTLEEDQDIKTGWEDKIANLARNVIQDQSPKQLYSIHGELQNLIEHNVASDFICKAIIKELKKNIPERLQTQFDKLSDEHRKNYDIRVHLASSRSQQEEHCKRQNVPRKNIQNFMMIEEFIARFMSWYKGVKTKK